MKVPLFIPFRNRMDLLEKAVRSVDTNAVEINILDNSNGPTIGFPGVDLIYRRPTVPLSFTQTQNWMTNIAEGDSDYEDFYLWMHSDAEAEPGTIDRLVEMARSQTCKWGVIYTYYDILCAYKTKAFMDVGGYDTNFFDYASDCDIYRRLRLSGYELLESNLPVKHVGSSTLKSDPFENFRVGVQVDYRTRYYTEKWGGNTGKELFQEPWNGRFRKSPLFPNVFLAL